MQSLMILGRQPSLGLAELESLYGADKLEPVGSQAAVVDVDPCLLAFNRLGGSLKFCKLLTVLETVNWKQIEKYLLEVSAGHSQRMQPGKMNLGLSLYGFDSINPKQIEATGLKLKKTIRASGRPVRLVPNKENELNSAQVIHNDLTGPNGWELVFVRNGNKTYLAQTVKVQDIASYTRRDRGRPKRDARVGMLPPKLAQIILNLSVGKLPEDQLSNICDIPADQPLPRPKLNRTVLDPFCGTGVIMQEAALSGYETYGTDIEKRMVEYSRQNLMWLANEFGVPPVCCRVETGDATNYQWKSQLDFVASETYLGRAFTAKPSQEVLEQTISDCQAIIKKFMQNLQPQLHSGARLCLAVPAWQIKPGSFRHLPLIDKISELGYNRVKFEHVKDEDLIYYRDDQFVARELLVLTRK